MKSAGIVKMMPDASDELADSAVCEMLHSRIVGLPMSGVSKRSTATDTTASGMEVLMVSPTRRPR